MKNTKNNSKRIAILVSHPIQYFTPLFKKLADRPNIDLTVYFCWDFGVEAKHDPEFNKKIKWDIPILDGYKHVFLKNVALNPSSSRPWGEINLGIIPVIFKEKYDFIIVTNWNFITSWLAFFSCIISGTPFLIRSESPLSQEIMKSSYKLKIKKIIFSRLFKFASGLLYIGKENREFYKFYGVSDNKLFFTPYAIDNNRFIESSKKLKNRRSELRKKHNIPEDSIVVLTVGKLINKKRPLDLLRAYESTIEKVGLKNRRCILYFVGDGPLRKKIEEYIIKNKLDDVIITGFKNQLELPEYYVMADIFVLPSQKGETWGLVVNEAMCFGLPIILSNIVGCKPDLLKEGVNGYSFPVGNIGILTKKLEALIGNTEKRKQFGKKSFEIIQGYNYNKDVEGVLRAINE